MRRTEHHFYDIPVKDAESECNHDETTDKFKPRGNL